MQDNRKDRTLIQALMDQLRRILRKKQFPSEGDPYAYVGAPLRRGPKGRSGAARIRAGASRRGVSSASRIVHP